MRFHRSRFTAVLSGAALFLSAAPSHGTVHHASQNPDPGPADVSVLSPTGPVTRADHRASNPWRLRSRPSRVNPSRLQPLCDPSASGSPATLDFNLFDDVTVKPATTLIERAATGDSLNWRGQVPGDPESSVTLTAVNACHGGGAQTWLSATITDHGKLYTVDATGPRQVTVSELDPGMYEIGDPAEAFQPAAPKPGPDGRSRPTAAPTGPTAPTRLKSRPVPSPGKRLSSAGCEVSTTPVIDVLALYTPQAALEVGGDQQAEIQIASAEPLANLALANSRINARFRIVRIEKAAGYTGTDDNTGLDAFRAGTAGVDARGLRDKYGADVAVLFTSDGSGVGYTPVLPNASTADAGFSQVNITYIANSTMTHEIGHNLGADHDWVASDRILNPAYPYNHGYTPPSKRWRTVMAYPAICNGCVRVPYFSNPDVSYLGEATGTRDDRPHPADNAHVLNLSARAVSDYEPTKYPMLLCALDVSTEPSEGGSARTDVAGPYLSGTTVIARARPASGYSFAGWTLDGKPYGAGSSITVRSDADKHLVARFVGGAANHIVAVVNRRRFF